MLSRLRRVVAKTLVHEQALQISLVFSAVGMLVFVLAYLVAAFQVGDPDDPFGLESAFLGLLVMVPMFVLPVGVVALRGAWVARRAVVEIVSEERRLRALKADPSSAYGLPGFPEVGAGSGDLNAVESGGVAEVPPAKAEITRE